MLFLISYRPRAGRAEAEDKRVLNLFVNWKPPAGITIKSHYVRADGGGLVIVDADSALSMVEGNATWAAYFDHEVTPIVEVAEALPALQRVANWRESVRQDTQPRNRHPNPKAGGVPEEPAEVLLRLQGARSRVRGAVGRVGEAVSP